MRFAGPSNHLAARTTQSSTRARRPSRTRAPGSADRSLRPLGCSPLVQPGDLQTHQRGRTGSGAFIRETVVEAGQDPLGLAPGADSRTTSRVDLATLAQVVDELGRARRIHVVHELPV